MRRFLPSPGTRLRLRLATLYRVVLPGVLEGLAARMRREGRLPPSLLARALARRLFPGLMRCKGEAAPQRPSAEVIAAARTAIARFVPTEPDLARLRDLDLNGLLVVPGPITARGLAWRRAQPLLEAPVRRMILVPWLGHGGAERVALNAFRAAEAQDGPGRTLLVVTDSRRVEAPGWLPEGARLLVLEGGEGLLLMEDRVALVAALVQRLRPAAVLNVNSRAGWEALLRHGRPLSALTRLSAYVFCEDHDALGRRVDYAYLHLRAVLPHLAAVYSDHAAFLDAFAAAHALPPDERAKLRPVPQPAPAPTPPLAPPDKPFRVLWAGRITAQKGPDLLPAIARALPGMRFEVHGAGARDEVRAALRGAPPNLTLHGSFGDFAALGAGRHHAFLYTARWDGLPNVLLEAGAAGLPIVTSLAGGIGELVSDATGWPVATGEDPAAYVAALRALRADPAAATARAARLSALIAERHSVAAHAAALRAGSGFLWDGAS
ncbi:glycosyltransferase family 4 protein [Roseococcus suduntuyensis]|uniref:Glycosyltransferase involved in cell wall biosynthesis n=1 Tax=Roseococcus suduntuyensis TaxID=455361 RepID=A0A840AIJ6_9PROT|nr:glycosyltransferase family 4 protein [Roseococcus suduntuyensis]MBB3899885.1 glycosyltransferase involved in cell wall biosynthesis [Roseococcus suduntuyensis]